MNTKTSWLLPLWFGLTGCELFHTSFVRCETAEQCVATFGSDSTCRSSGFCSPPDDPSPAPTPVRDADGDGVAAPEDCDDGDPDRWESGALEVARLTADLVPGLCDSRCVAMSTLSGSIELQEDATTVDLSDLDCLVEVRGSVEIRATGRSSLSGLQHLDRIGGDLTIHDEPALRDLAGLSGLSTLGGSLTIEMNATLDSLGELDELETIGGGLAIHDNPSLSDERGGALAVRVSVTGPLDIRDNGLRLDFVNPGFEMSDGARNPTDWITFPFERTNRSVASTGELLAPSEPFSAFEGTAGLSVFPSTQSGDFETKLYQEHESGFVEGQRFALSGHAFVSSTRPFTGNCLCELVLYQYGPSFTFLTETRSTPIDASFGQDQWIEIELSAPIVAGATLIQPSVEYEQSTGCDGAVYWDEMRFRVADPP